MNSFSATVSATVPTISASVSTISAIINSPILKLILMITHHTIITFLSEDISPNNGYFIAPVSLSWSRIVVQVIHVTGLIAVSVARLLDLSLLQGMSQASLSWSRIVVQVLYVTGLIAVCDSRLIAASGNVASRACLMPPTERK